MIRSFAATLDPEAVVFDLREPNLGEGFAWGRARKNDIVHRHGYERVFGFVPRKTLWQRILGGA